MGEMADLCLASSDPCDEFERSGESGQYGSYVPCVYHGVGTLQEKSPLRAKIDGKEYTVTEKATQFLMYIKVGERVDFRRKYNTNEIYYIRRKAMRVANK